MVLRVLGKQVAMSFESRHESTRHMLRLFEFGHLPQQLADISARFSILATEMVVALPDGPELTAGLRKLLEAKDCFVRAMVLSSETPALIGSARLE